MYVISDRIIKKAKKAYYCDACNALHDYIQDNRKYGLKMTIDEIRTYIKAKQNGFKIQAGESYFSQFVKDGGDVFFNKSIYKIHEICCRLELYDND